MRLLAQNDVKVPAQGIFYAPGWEKSPFEGMKYWFSVVIVPFCSVVRTHRAGHAADSFEPLPSVFGIKSLYVSCEAVDAGLTPPVSLLNDCLGLARRVRLKRYCVLYAVKPIKKVTEHVVFAGIIFALS